MIVKTVQSIKISREEAERLFDSYLEDLTVGEWACVEGNKSLHCPVVRAARKLQVALKRMRENKESNGVSKR